MIINLFILLLILILLLEIYYHYNFINKIKKDLPKNILAPLDKTIELPNIEKKEYKIYRTYYDINLINNFKVAHNETNKTNPDLEQVYYDDNMVEEFIKNNTTERIYNAYKNINPSYGPARADFFRYLIIYKYGGIYLDIKSSLSKNIKQEINEKKLIVSKGRKKEYYPFSFGYKSQKINNYNWSYFSDIEYGEYNNWHFISPAGNNILGKVIQQMVSNIEYGVKNKNYYNHGEYSVLSLTGPIMFTKVINKFKDNKYLSLKDINLNKKVKYNASNKDHKKIGYKKHYSLIKEKNILIK